MPKADWTSRWSGRVPGVGDRQDGRATTHPIAGTRWRGQTEEEDVLLEKELLADDKERAEHLMLVDLGRNDLGRVCRPGTVRVEDYSHIERYSHVMHLVSTVTGELAEGKTALDAVTACFRQERCQARQGAGDGADRGSREDPPGSLRRRAGVPGFRRRRRFRDRDPNHVDA